MADAPVQPSLRRMRQFGLRPDRDLGQNFLIDSNILGVIDRAAALTPEDVVLEIGGGLGVLSEHLAARVHHVHVIELDQRLRPALEDAVRALTNVTLRWEDAMDTDLPALTPAPSKLVANLPYGIAAAILLRTIQQLPNIQLWVAMVQREVGERLAAAPGSSAYGTPSVIAQLSCRVEVIRAVPRTVFHPVPNVDSVFIRLSRIPRTDSDSDTGTDTDAAPPGSSDALHDLVGAAFRHRRKTLAGSLALAQPLPGVPAFTRHDVRAAVQQLGHPADVRAERLSPEDFLALSRQLGI
jgi:16S rRNA (adenine1518-N6/adenine1519-N6)-dimethyltransferase